MLRNIYNTKIIPESLKSICKKITYLTWNDKGVGVDIVFGTSGTITIEPLQRDKNGYSQSTWKVNNSSLHHIFWCTGRELAKYLRNGFEVPETVEAHFSTYLQ